MIVRGKKKNELTFVFNNPRNVKTVYLAGSFNHWAPRDKRMTRAKDGTFRAKMALSPGKYEYKFVADGIWMEDSEADKTETNEFGTTNSVVEVS